MARKSTWASDTESCRAALRDAGLRVTPARIAVLKIIREADRPLSHADICALLVDSLWNRTTIWRNLSDLENASLIRRAELGDRLWRFEQNVEEGAHHDDAHPHFICTSCGEVSCLPETLLRIPESDALPRSVVARQMDVQIRGVCDKCD